MKYFYKICIIGWFFTFASYSYPQDSGSINDILNSAETFFKSLADKNFSYSWEFLSAKSKKVIIDDVYTASKSSGVTYTHEQLWTDFKINGLIARTYWNGFLKNFDPNIVLDKCIWEKVLHKENYALIVIRYQKSDAPFHLKMYKEDGAWKVGLIETFLKK